jgi:hypothetical protein
VDPPVEEGAVGLLAVDPIITEGLYTPLILASRLWWEVGQTSLTSVFERSRTPLSEVLQPISPGDVDRCISRLKPSFSPEPDGITKTSIVKAKATSIITKLFNLLLATGGYPASWRRKRVFFIPKAAKDPSLFGSWRPITNASMLARLYSGLLDERLRGLPAYPLTCEASQIKVVPQKLGNTQ